MFADKIKNENIRSDVKHRTDSYCYYSNTKVSYIELIVFLLFHKTSKNRDAFKLLSLYTFWVYSPFPAFNSKHETQLPNLTLFCQFQVAS